MKVLRNILIGLGILMLLLLLLLLTLGIKILGTIFIGFLCIVGFFLLVGWIIYSIGKSRGKNSVRNSRQRSDG
ncbi:MAG: hypothetical protein LUD68_03040 [Rikenellaceae bacterium]|nr:hypothetical protein [Rikenellaceae bacterium]